jgi:hypothetical protein
MIANNSHLLGSCKRCPVEVDDLSARVTPDETPRQPLPVLREEAERMLKEALDMFEACGLDHIGFDADQFSNELSDDEGDVNEDISGIDDTPNPLLCILCHERARDCIYGACGHVITCSFCATAWTNEYLADDRSIILEYKCPVCSAVSSKLHRVFL